MNDFKPECDTSIPYAKGPHNRYDDKEQWIRLSEGCPNKCPFCRESYENPEPIMFEIPELLRNDVKIMDMNLLSHPEALEIIKELGRRRANGKVIYYECVCGIDYRFLNQEIASALRQSRFKNIRMAWDFSFKLQMKMKDSIKMLFNAGYKGSDITIFMICNWKTTFKDNMRKLDLCKIWGVKAADCYYDNQLAPNIKPIYWTDEQNKEFKAKVRKHNQLVRFGIDPEEYRNVEGS